VKATKRFILGVFNDRQLVVIQLRAKGLSARQIAKRTGSTEQAIKSVIKWIYRRVGDAIPRKGGEDNWPAWKRWAEEMGLDEALEPETAETREISRPRVFKQRIKLGRLRRAGILQRGGLPDSQCEYGDLQFSGNSADYRDQRFTS
jgi:hypothetical protein